MNAFGWSTLYFRNEDTKLRHTKATMAALFSYADFEDLTCYPSQSTLARVTGSCTETVRRHIRTNVDAGWLEILEQGNSYKSSTRYRLAVPTPHTGEGSQSDELPTPMRGVEQPPSQARSTPHTAVGSTPHTGARLTTHTTIQEPFNGSWRGTTPDPFGGSGDSSSTATNQIPTPHSSVGSDSPLPRGELPRWDPLADMPIRPSVVKPHDGPDPFAGRPAGGAVDADAQTPPPLAEPPAVHRSTERFPSPFDAM